MIDEKKLIRTMWDRYNGHYNNANRFCEEETEMAYSILSDLQLTIENMPKVGEWIPCSERLPEDCETVIFATEDGFVEAGWYDAKKNWCEHEGYFPNAFDFVAWMPLPEPYKEE